LWPPPNGGLGTENFSLPRSKVTRKIRGEGSEASPSAGSKGELNPKTDLKIYEFLPFGGGLDTDIRIWWEDFLLDSYVSKDMGS